MLGPRTWEEGKKYNNVQMNNERKIVF